MIDCTWCRNGKGVILPGEYVVLFACLREHFTAYPLCSVCAEAARGHQEDDRRYYCRECGTAADPMILDPWCAITLVCSREQWLEWLDQGRVRFVREVRGG